MSAAAQVLGVWLTPVLWLSMPMLILERGPDGLWIALVLTVAPLIALATGAPRPASTATESLFPVVILLLTVGMLFWANMTLAGDVSAWVGVPRWHGIALCAGGACLLTAWPGAWRLVPALLLLAALAMTVPLIELGRNAGVGPLVAWETVATRTAFRFPTSSPWVMPGLDLGRIAGRAPIRFEEEHRVTAPSGGRIYARVSESGRSEAVERTLAAGQSILFRPGDRLQNGSTLRVQFEADKRVPGSPVSGVAWAAGRPIDWPRSLGLLLTVLFGALVLCRAAHPMRTSRSTVAMVAGGGLAAFFWAQSWALYSLLLSPDVFLGAVTPERLLVLPALPDDQAVGPSFRALVLGGGLASFLASSVVLRERLSALDPTGGGEVGRDLGLWTGLFAIAGLAAIWRLDCWALVLVALGAAGSSLGAIALSPAAVPSPGMTTVAGSVGLAVFSALALMGQIRTGPDGLLGALLAYPAMAAVPASFLALLVCRMLSPR